MEFFFSKDARASLHYSRLFLLMELERNLKEALRQRFGVRGMEKPLLLGEAAAAAELAEPAGAESAEPTEAVDLAGEGGGGAMGKILQRFIERISLSST